MGGRNQRVISGVISAWSKAKSEAETMGRKKKKRRRQSSSLSSLLIHPSPELFYYMFLSLILSLISLCDWDFLVSISVYDHVYGDVYGYWNYYRTLVFFFSGTQTVYSGLYAVLDNLLAKTMNQSSVWERQTVTTVILVFFFSDCLRQLYVVFSHDL